MKLLTTITALARPDADEPFKTEVWYQGVIERDTLKGDIYVVGGYDPEFYPASDYKEWLKGLATLRKISLNKGKE
jgi:D-alanyl-D-alanine carboxypeptidase